MTTNREWFEQTLKGFQADFEFRLESKAMEFTERICAEMNSMGVSRASLAEKLGKSKSYVSRILNNVDVNLTLSTMLQFAEAVDCEFKLDVVRKEASESEEREGTTLQFEPVSPSIFGELRLSSFQAGLFRDVATNYSIAGTGSQMMLFLSPTASTEREEQEEPVEQPALAA